jgi:hypothetical protein
MFGRVALIVTFTGSIEVANLRANVIGVAANIAQTCGLVPVSECMRRLVNELELSG